MQLPFFLFNSSFSSKGNSGPNSPSKLYSRLVTLRCRNTTERWAFLISRDSQDSTMLIALTSTQICSYTSYVLLLRMTLSAVLIISLYLWMIWGQSIPRSELGIINLSHIRPLLLLKGLVFYYDDDYFCHVTFFPS